jgi:hypothetical protein
MKKLVTTLDINYDKEITDITFPYMKEYANQIGADLHIQTTRLFPELPVSVEKFYLYSLIPNYDVTIFLDADCIVNPFSTPDLTEIALYEKDAILVPEHIDPPHQFNEKIIQFQCPLYFSVLTPPVANAFNPFWIEENIDVIKTFRKDINNKSEMHKHYEFSREVKTENIWFMDEFLFNYNIMKHKLPTVSIKELVPQQTFVAHIAATKESKLKFLKESAAVIENWREHVKIST